METTLTTPPPSETVKIGPDLVTISEQQVIIDAVHEMPDWQVREYARIPIYFRDKKYFLRQKGPAPKPYARRYILDPWPADDHQITRSSLTYDEETVAQREGGIRTDHVNDAVHAMLILFYPVLGFLWSKTKEKLPRFGFAPRPITAVSIFATFGLFLTQLAFAKLLMMTSLRTGQVVIGGMIRAFSDHEFLSLGPLQIRVLWLDVVLLVVLLLDCLIRYTQYLRDPESHWGFLEWLTCLRPGRKASADVAEVNG